MRRTSPNRTAIESSAGPSTRASSGRVSGSAQLTYSGAASGSAARTPASWRAGPRRHARRRRTRARAASSARRRTGAAARCSGVQPHVARAHGQAVGLAHDRAGHDLRADAQVAGHAPDDQQLLGVLLAEVGAFGAGQRRAGSRRPSSRPRSGPAAPRPPAARSAPRPAPSSGSRPGRPPRPMGCRQDVRPACAGTAARRPPRLGGSFSKSAASLNWRGLTKIVTSDGRVLGAGPADQRGVAFVEGAHGRHEADRSSRPRPARRAAPPAFGRPSGWRPASATGLEVPVERDAAARLDLSARSSGVRPRISSSDGVVHADALSGPGKVPASTSAW